jgi:hypothetical protein
LLARFASMSMAQKRARDAAERSRVLVSCS